MYHNRRRDKSCMKRWKLENHAGVATAILALAVLAAGGLYCLRLGDRLRYPDEKEYVRISEHVASRGVFSFDGITPTVSRPPGYPAALAALRACGVGLTGCRFFSFVMHACGVWLVYRLARRHGDSRAGLLAAAATAGFPVFFYTAGTFYPQTLASSLLVVLSLTLLETRRMTCCRAVAIGMLLGILLLLIPAFSIVALCVGVWMLGTRGSDEGSCEHPNISAFRSRWIPAATAAVVALVCVSPWIARNHRVTGEWIFISANSGVNLLLGNSEHTRPNAGVNVDISAYREQTASMMEVAADRFYAREARRYIVENPARSVGLYVRKFLNYFNYRNELRTRSEGTRWRELVMLVTYWPLLIIVGLRLFQMRRYPLSRAEAFMLLVYVANGLFLAVFFTRIRFRVPFDYLLIVLAAMHVSRWVGQMSSLEGRVPPPLADGVEAVPPTAGVARGPIVLSLANPRTLRV